MNKKFPYINKGNWEVKRDLIVEDFKLFATRKSLRRDLRNNHEIDFLLIDGLDWANIIALTDKKEVVMVKQYRHGIEDFTFEFPGGVIETGEDPKKGVMRELQEESGYAVTDATLLGTLRPNPAMFSNYISYYVAHGAKNTGTTSFDPGEDLETMLVPIPELWQMAAEGKIVHALNVAAIGLLRLKYPNL